MSLFYSRNVVLLAKIQAACGTEESPVVATDAIRVRDQVTPKAAFASLQTNYVTGSIDASDPVIGGGNMKFPLKTWVTGAGTAGTAPDWGKLLRACACQQVLTAAAVTGTAQAGDTDQITLAASGSSSTDDAYVGMPVELTGGTGDGQTRVITAYNGTTKVAKIYPDWDEGDEADETSEYSIAANARYTPITDGQENITIHQYLRNSATGGQAKKRRGLDQMGNFQLALKPGNFMELNFDCQGVLAALPADVSDPGDPVLTGPDPAPYLNALTYLGGAKVQFNDFSLNGNNGVQQDDDPDAAYGYAAAEVTTRSITGSITPPMVLAATRDAFSDWVGSVSRPLLMLWGPASGKRALLYIPALRYTDNTPGSTNGRETEALQFQISGPIYLTVF